MVNASAVGRPLNSVRIKMLYLFRDAGSSSPKLVLVMKPALVFYRCFGLIKIETIKPIPTITSTTFQTTLPKAILING